MADRAGEVWITAEVRIGEELIKLPKAEGTRGQLVGPGVIGSSKSVPPIDAPTLAELGVAKKRAARNRRLAQPEKYREMLYSAAYAKAMAETSNTTAALRDCFPATHPFRGPAHA